MVMIVNNNHCPEIFRQKQITMYPPNVPTQPKAEKTPKEKNPPHCPKESTLLETVYVIFILLKKDSEDSLRRNREL